MAHYQSEQERYAARLNARLDHNESWMQSILLLIKIAAGLWFAWWLLIMGAWALDSKKEDTPLPSVDNNVSDWSKEELCSAGYYVAQANGVHSC